VGDSPEGAEGRWDGSLRSAQRWLRLCALDCALGVTFLPISLRLCPAPVISCAPAPAPASLSPPVYVLGFLPFLCLSTWALRRTSCPQSQTAEAETYPGATHRPPTGFECA